MAKDAKGHGSDKRGGAMPIPGHDYHNKTSDQLRYIAKDASEAEQASRGLSSYNPNSGAREDTSGKYSDQLNNAASVLGYRARGGTDFSDKSAAQELAAGGGPKAVAAPVHEAMSGGKFGPFASAVAGFREKYGAPRDLKSEARGFASGRREINSLKRQGK